MSDHPPIIFVADDIYPNAIGGMQMHSFRLVKEWLEMGQKVTLIYPLELDNDQIPVLFKPHVESKTLVLIQIPKQKKFAYPWSYLLGELTYAKKVAKEIAQIKGSVVYTQGLTGIKLTKKKLAGIKHVTNPHGLEPFQEFFYKNTAAFVYRKLFKILFKKADSVISLGGDLTNILKNNQVPAKKILVLPNGIPNIWISNEVSMHENEKVKCLFVGRDEKRKGLPILIEAFNKTNNKQLSLSIVGPIDKKQYASKKNITWLGAIHEEQALKAAYDQYDVLICPSFAEGMPTVILEAMARGLAVIATNVGATAELVSSENGFLIAPNSTGEVKDALARLSKNEALLSMKKSSLSHAKEFTWDKIAAKTLKEITSI